MGHERSDVILLFFKTAIAVPSKESAMTREGKKRVIIERLKPEIDCGRFPIKRAVGEEVILQADIFADGHDAVAASLLYRQAHEETWREAPMKLVGNDRWEGMFIVEEVGVYHYTVQGWVDHFQTWQKDLRKKFEAGQNVKVDVLVGAGHIEAAAERASGADAQKLQEWARTLRGEKDVARAVSLALSEEITTLMKTYPDKRWATTYDKELVIIVDRPKALFSTWYEMFPRSCSPEPGRHGTLKTANVFFPRSPESGSMSCIYPRFIRLERATEREKITCLWVNPVTPEAPGPLARQREGIRPLSPDWGR